MRFMIQVLGFIIFAFLISNIAINLENLSVEFNKHTNVEAEDEAENEAENNVYNTTSRNNTYINNTNQYYFFANENLDLIVLTISLIAITICVCLCIRKITRCNRCARRNYPLYFTSNCCVDIHNNPNDPPPPNLVVNYQPEAAD